MAWGSAARICGYDVGRGNQVDVMAPLLLKKDHDGGKLVIVDVGGRLLLVADIIVLAEETEQVAGSEKNGSRSVLPYQWTLFAEMRAKACHLCPPTHIAYARGSFDAIHLAALRADGAAGQHPLGGSNSSLQFAGFKESQIAGGCWPLFSSQGCCM